MDLKSLVRSIPDYPKPPIVFRDITTLLADPKGFSETIRLLAARYADAGIEVVAAIEARGFILGGGIAHALGAGFVPVRKKGKLPSATIGCDYDLEYGVDRVEMHTDALSRGARVLVVDDLIATGGTAEAAASLVERLGCEIFECCFVIDLPDLGGRKRLESRGRRVFSLMEFQGD